MSTTEVPDLALDNVDTSRTMYRVTAELNEIATAVDRVSEAFPSEPGASRGKPCHPEGARLLGQLERVSR
jgi:hypothetical protein